MAIETAQEAVSHKPIHENIIRPQANFEGSIWGDQFMNYIPDTQVTEIYSKEIEVLKEEVRSMLAAHGNEMVETMSLIDTLERLGISYHFENEIEDKVRQFFNEKSDYKDEFSDLYTVGVHFRIFRQHGYRMSSEIFKTFKDENGNFKEALKSDVKGLLSLYEASHLRVHGETILEDALVFATTNLKSIEHASGLCPRLRKQVTHALTQPLHFGLPRIEAHSFISMYGEYESNNKTILMFAKLDYNLVQMLHKQELCELSRWGKEIISKLPYARDRLVECYLWALGTYFEPQYSNARVMLAKAVTLISLMDDIYDSHGTLEELVILTEAIQRWDATEINLVLETMRPLYKAIIETYTQFEKELANEGRAYAVFYAIEAVKELARGYYQEAIWFNQGFVPSFAEYMENANITGNNALLTPVSLLGIETATREDYVWLSMKPKLVIAGAIKARLFNDMASYEREKENGQIVTGIDCYMKENSVTKEVTMFKYTERIANAWKDTNEECLQQSNCPRHVFLRELNYDRLCEVVYKNNKDGHTNPQVLKDHIIALLVDPIKISQTQI